MPYSDFNDESLPENIKKMPEADRKVWVGAFNGAHKSCMDKEGADAKQCESSAFAIANAAVNKGNKGILEDIMEAPIIDLTATTFEELDAEHTEMEAAEQMNEVSSQTSLLVNNVMRNPTIEDKPSALQRIVDGLKLKLSALMMKTKKEKFIPKSKDLEESYFTATKDIDGNYRWFSLVTNHFRDADNPPEIFETKAHREFVDYLDKGGKYPELWLWHTPGTKCGIADWVDFDHGFLMASGTFDKDKKDIADKLALDNHLGVSHGYNYRYSNKEKGIIGWYRSFEISPLPKEAAANPYTGIEIIRQEAKDMNPNKRAFLVGKLGEDRVKELESRPAEMEKALKDQGIEYKEVETPPSTPPPLAPASTKEITDAAVKAVTESEAFKALNTSLAEAKSKSETLEKVVVEMGKTIKELQKSEDEKIAAVISPRSPVAAGLKRASESKDNLVDPVKDKELTVAAPSWLGSALGGMTK